MQADAIAGVTVGIMAVPEAISYANLAGLPSEFGMTATLVPCAIYALFGSSRQLVRPGLRLCSRRNEDCLQRWITLSASCPH